MAYLYLDDSKHHRSGFSLAAFVVCDADPTEHIRAIFRTFGYNPNEFEYKSSARMAGDKGLQGLRTALKSYVSRNCRIALCVVDGDKRLGPAALKLLASTLTHPSLKDQEHEVFFDQGLFQSVKAASEIANEDNRLQRCTFHFEQDSRTQLGIQLADMIAHTCSIMLLEALGDSKKKVVLQVPGDHVYDGEEVELGFEMWAGIRYAFLSLNKPNPRDDFELAHVDVYPWGLFVDDSVSRHISDATMKRFGEIYLGCIH